MRAPRTVGRAASRVDIAGMLPSVLARSAISCRFVCRRRADLVFLTAARGARIAALKRVIDDIASHGQY
jgi:hypothetical protein